VNTKLYAENIFWIRSIKKRGRKANTKINLNLKKINLNSQDTRVFTGIIPTIEHTHVSIR
jgi:hypothetical protein